MSFASIAVIAATFAAADDETFPYDAVVRSDTVDVRSGPGEAFYVTSRLAYEDRVTVHRHDRGGWFMISPPPGSFSYIRVNHVKTSDGQSGVVSIEPYEDGRPARSVVRIGSTLSDDAAFSGRQLTDGESVRILGRKMVRTDGGMVEMFKIAPPDKEYRWVKGDFIARSGEAVSRPEKKPVDPFDGALVAEFGAEDTPQMVTSNSGGTPSMTTRRQHNPSPDALLGQRQQLEKLDDRFRSTVGQDPGSWRLDDLERDYRSLQEGSLTDALVGQIEQRLAAIKRRREVLDRYEAFVRLTSETSEREQKLLALQAAAGARVGETADVSGRLGIPGNPPEEVTPVAPPKKSVETMPRLDGAGLIQKRNPRLPTGPRYALVAADGRVLAYLRSSSGMNLEMHVGQERGVVGNRQFDPILKGDVIDVRRLVPVQLRR